MLWRLAAWSLQSCFRAVQSVNDYGKPFKCISLPSLFYKITCNTMCCSVRLFKPPGDCISETEEIFQRTRIGSMTRGKKEVDKGTKTASFALKIYKTHAQTHDGIWSFFFIKWSVKIHVGLNTRQHSIAVANPISRSCTVCVLRVYSAVAGQGLDLVLCLCWNVVLQMCRGPTMRYFVSHWAGLF